MLGCDGIVPVPTFCTIALYYFFLGVGVVSTTGGGPVQAQRTVQTFGEKFSSVLHTNIAISNSSKKSIKSDAAPVAVKKRNASARVLPSLDRPSGIEEAGLPKDAATIVRDEHALEPRLRMTTKTKEKYLKEYVDSFPRADTNTPLVATKPGKNSVRGFAYPPSTREIIRPQWMRPTIHKTYRVDDLSFENVLVVVLKHMPELNVQFRLTESDYATMMCLSADIREIVSETRRLMKVDFSSLREPMVNYAEQTEIDEDRVDQAGAAMVHAGLDPGMMIRWLGNEYTAAHRDVETTLAAIKPHVSEEDYTAVREINYEGSPHNLELLESNESKMEMIGVGNGPTIKQFAPLVRKTLIKELRYSHMIAVPRWMLKTSPYCRHTRQDFVDNKRMIWNATTKTAPLQLVLNEVTPTEGEPEVTFGTTQPDFYNWVYNTRLRYPGEEIYLGLADVTACFRYARIHPDLAGAMGFEALGYYFLSTSNVFGSVTSCQRWEPLRRAILALTTEYAERDDLVEKHAKYLAMLEWEEPCEDTSQYVPAHPCELNQGVGDNKMRGFMYVDDALLAAAGKQRMKRLIAAILEAIYVVMGEPNDELRRNHLSIDKWAGQLIEHHKEMLSIRVDTRRMVIGMSRTYLDKCLALIDEEWPANKPTFTANEASRLVGKLARLGAGCIQVFKLISHMYTSIAYALSRNKAYLKESGNEEFLALSKMIDRRRFSSKDEHIKITRFALKKEAKMVHKSPRTFPVVATLEAEVAFFRDALRPDSGIAFDSPLSHAIKRQSNLLTAGDSCLVSGGGFSTVMQFVWYLDYKPEVVNRTLKHIKDNKDGLLVSINVLEFVCVIINYAAAYTVLTTEKITEDPYPVILNLVDNTSAHNWTTHACKSSNIGRRLGRFFCGLLMGSHVGINSKWISTTDNEIADEISRAKKTVDSTTTTNHSPDWQFDYSTLKQRFPQLKNCRVFQPAPELLSKIWEIVLTESFPDLKEIATLRRNGLGKLIT